MYAYREANSITATPTEIYYQSHCRELSGPDVDVRSRA